MINAHAHTDDYAIEVDFDAQPYFEANDAEWHRTWVGSSLEVKTDEGGRELVRTRGSDTHWAPLHRQARSA